MSKKPVKFASQIDPQVLKELRVYAHDEGRSISGIVSEAVAEYLARARVRPVFRDAAELVMAENAELLARLAK
jgi:hypothetical protein